MFQEGISPDLLQKKERKNIRREIQKKKSKKNKKRERERERARKKERERESHGPTHSSSSCTQTIKRLLLFLSKPLLLYSDRQLLTCKRETYLASIIMEHFANGSSLQGTLFPRRRQEYHTPLLQQLRDVHLTVSILR